MSPDFNNGLVRFVRICLFDIDGTLLLSGRAGQRAIETVLRDRYNLTKPVEGINTAGRTDMAILYDLLQYYEIEPTVERIREFQNFYLEQLPIELERCPGEVLPGVIDRLEELQDHPDVHLGLLTGNLARGASLKINHYRLQHFFTFGSYGDHHINRDDVAREALVDIRQRFGGDVQSENIWIIGDTPADVQCAHAISARAVAVATGIYSTEELAPAEPDVLINDLTEVNLLKVLFGEDD
ncbi:Phosphoglycolate phosphatase [Polystyrenella longa]|uniref:phosphoglycolate phosphatase n=2 Tax=Polystyrenella longa TaxID=2528007 RepID=A0A518CSP6_9PLAN|nr:Phosphoglycolate phosphatase [Polystyrenella longa]